MKPQQLEYHGPGELMNKNDAILETPEEHRYTNLLNGIFMELDMTDYQDTMLHQNAYFEDPRRRIKHPAAMDPEVIETFFAPMQNALPDFE